MSIEINVHCNGCTDFILHHGESIHGAREYAAEFNWTSIRGMDYCPNCAEKVK